MSCMMVFLFVASSAKDVVRHGKTFYCKKIESNSIFFASTLGSYLTKQW